MRTTWNFFSAGQIHFGRGAVKNVGSLAKALSLSRVLIVTDPILVQLGIAAQVETALAASGIEFQVFAGGQPEPSIEVAQQAADVAKRFQPDVVLGLGGGSNLDLAKIVAVLLSHGGTPGDYFGWDRVPGPVCPIIGVPTTSGTGSEVSHAAVLTDTANHIKVSTLSNYLRPALAVVDPELTLTCPGKATADSGIDALTHAIEAYSAIDHAALDVPPGETWPYDGRTPLGDVLAEKAIALVAQHLRTAVHSGQNATAREGMSLAATLAGLAFSNYGVAVVHALEYPLGGVWHCSHGAGNGLLLPYVMRFNLPVRAAQFARLAPQFNLDVAQLSDQAAAEKVIEAIEQLRRDIGIPERIRELGGRRERLPELAHKAHQIQRLMKLNPRYPSEADLLGIYEAAW